MAILVWEAMRGLVFGPSPNLGSPRPWLTVGQAVGVLGLSQGEEGPRGRCLIGPDLAEGAGLLEEGSTLG